MIALRPIRLRLSSEGVTGGGGRWSYCDDEPSESGFVSWSRYRYDDDNYGKDFTWRTEEDEPFYDSDPMTPRLWEPSLDSESTRAIAEYQREMMERVRRAPGTDFELSVRDLVIELSPAENLAAEAEASVAEKAEGDEVAKGSIGKVIKGTSTGRKFARTESMNSSVFLLRVFFPFPGGGGGGRREGSGRQRGGSRNVGEGGSCESDKRRRGSGCRTFFTKIFSFYSIKNKKRGGGG